MNFLRWWNYVSAYRFTSKNVSPHLCKVEIQAVQETGETIQDISVSACVRASNIFNFEFLFAEDNLIDFPNYLVYVYLILFFKMLVSLAIGLHRNHVLRNQHKYGNCKYRN